MTIMALADRALAAVHQLEALRLAINNALMAIGDHGRGFSRTLRLRWHFQRRRLEWMHLARRPCPQYPGQPPHEVPVFPTWKHIGRWVPPWIRETLASRTRSRLEGLEHQIRLQLQVLAATRALHRLLKQASARKGIPPVITVRWSGANGYGHLTWCYPFLKNRTHSQVYPVPKPEKGKRPMPFPSQTAAARAFLARQTHPKFQGVRGPLVERIETLLVEPLTLSEARLQALSAQCLDMRVWPRLYPTGEDGWSICQNIPANPPTTRYIPLGMVEAHLDPRRCAPAARQVLSEAHELLVRRAAIRRILLILADIAEAALLFPGGTWTVHGHDVGQKAHPWWYFATTGDGRVIFNPCYRKADEEPEPQIVLPDDPHADDTVYGEVDEDDEE